MVQFSEIYDSLLFWENLISKFSDMLVMNPIDFGLKKNLVRVRYLPCNK